MVNVTSSDSEQEDPKILVGRAEEVHALEQAGAIDAAYARKRLDIIGAAMDMVVRARRAALLQAIHDRWFGNAEK